MVATHACTVCGDNCERCRRKFIAVTALSNVSRISYRKRNAEISFRLFWKVTLELSDEKRARIINLRVDESTSNFSKSYQFSDT